MKRLALISLFVLCSCGSTSPAPDAPLRPIVPDGKEFCGPGCDHLKSINCALGDGPNSSNPMSCRDSCVEVMTAGVDLWPECWVTVNICSEVDSKCKR